MSNTAILVDLWAKSGQSIDQQRLRIFKLMTSNEQREILEQIERELTMKTNENKGILTCIK